MGKNMKKVLSIILMMAGMGYPSIAQVSITTDGNQPDPSAMLDVRSGNKGALVPRLSYDQRNAITNPAEGLLLYCTNCGENGSGTLSIFANGSWKNFTLCSAESPTPGEEMVSPGQITWNWNPVAGAHGYKWNSLNNYSTAQDLGNLTSKTETGILCNTPYQRFVWAYNGCGVSPAAVLACTTSVSIPPVPTPGTHAASSTQITWNFSDPLATGYKWNTTNNLASAVDIGNIHTKTETGLTCETSYMRYLWAYNACGYSLPVTLTQSTTVCQACETFTDPRDGKQYLAIQIGTQCWMRQNLNYGTMIDGADDQADNSIPEKYCYNNVETQCDVYGGLYQWAEMVQYYNGATNTTSWNPAPQGMVQGLCPAGWHLPSDAEWATLIAQLGGDLVAGDALKEAGETHWAEGNTGTNTSNFTALAGGLRMGTGLFGDQSYMGYFWASSEVTSTESWYLYLLFNDSGTNNGSAVKTTGLSVRCLKD